MTYSIDQVRDYLTDKAVEAEVLKHSDRFRSIDEFAAAHSLNPQCIYMTMALRGKKGGLVAACLPSTERVDFTEAARLLGWKSASMAGPDYVARIGVVKLGVTPFSSRWDAIVLHDAALKSARIMIGGGQGYDIAIDPREAVQKLQWRVASIATPR